MNVFLDLEEVIIDDWSSMNILTHNIERIKKELSKFDITSLNIFSMAIVNEEDLETFNNLLKNFIENEFGMEINKVFIFDKKFIKNLAKLGKIHMLPTDFMTDIFQRNPKEETFEIVVKHFFKDSVNVLFDDTVDNAVKNFHEGSPLVNDSTHTKMILVKI